MTEDWTGDNISGLDGNSSTVNLQFDVEEILKTIEPLVKAAAELLTDLADESKLRATLMIIELEQISTNNAEQVEQAGREAAKAKGATGMMAAPFGYCATCHEPNCSRTRGVNDTRIDHCPNGHAQLSTDSLTRPPKPDPPKPDPPNIELVRNDQTRVPKQEA